MTAETQTQTSVPTLPVFSGFKMPKRVVQGTTLSRLTGDQIKLLSYLYFRSWGARSLELPISDPSILYTTGLTVEQLDLARYDLSVIGLLGYELQAEVVRYFLKP
jgi:hypothetical protein